MGFLRRPIVVLNAFNIQIGGLINSRPVGGDIAPLVKVVVYETFMRYIVLTMFIINGVQPRINIRKNRHLLRPHRTETRKADITSESPRKS